MIWQDDTTLILSVHVVNIKLNFFNDWKALGWPASTEFAALVNGLHKPNRNRKNNNGKNPRDQSTSYEPLITPKTCFWEHFCMERKKPKFAGPWRSLISSKKCYNWTNQRDAVGHPCMEIGHSNFVAFTWHAAFWKWFVLLPCRSECPASKARG